MNNPLLHATILLLSVAPFASLSQVQSGCTDPSACNFNYTATSDDESCVYAIVAGDCDAGVIACGEGTHWNPLLQQCVVSGCQSCTGDLEADGLVNTPDLLAFLSLFGTTCPPPGCTDPMALNYNPQAQVNDGSCLYPPCLNLPPGTNCDGSCTIDEDFDGICDGEDDCVSINSGCHDAWLNQLPTSINLGCQAVTADDLFDYSMVVPDEPGCCSDNVVQIGGADAVGCFLDYYCSSQSCENNQAVLELMGVAQMGLAFDEFILPVGSYWGLSVSESLQSVPGIDSYSYRIDGSLQASDNASALISLKLFFNELFVGGDSWGELIPLVSFVDIPGIGRIVITQVNSLGSAPSYFDIPVDIVGSQFQWSCLKDGTVYTGEGVFSLPAAQFSSVLCADFCCEPAIACSQPIIRTAKFDGNTGHTFKETSINYSDNVPPTIQVDAPSVNVGLNLNGMGADAIDLNSLDIPFDIQVDDNCASANNIDYSVQIVDVGPFNFGTNDYLFIRSYYVVATDWSGWCAVWSNTTEAAFDQQIVITDIGN